MRGPREAVVVEASETALGVVQLAVIGNATNRLAVQASDGRLVQNGTAFPTDFMAQRLGTLFCRTDLGYDVFQWDGSRWLGLRTWVVAFTNQATVSSGGWLRAFQGPFTTALLGPKLPWDATLVEASGWKDNVLTASSFDLYDGSTLKYQLGINAADNETYATGLAVDLSAGAILNTKISVGALTSGGGIVFTFRRRAS